MSNNSVKFRKDLISSFWITLLTDKQTDVGENMNSLAEVIKRPTMRGHRACRLGVTRSFVGVQWLSYGVDARRVSAVRRLYYLGEQAKPPSVDDVSINALHAVRVCGAAHSGLAWRAGELVYQIWGCTQETQNFMITKRLFFYQTRL